VRRLEKKGKRRNYHQYRLLPLKSLDRRTGRGQKGGGTDRRNQRAETAKHEKKVVRGEGLQKGHRKFQAPTDSQRAERTGATRKSETRGNFPSNDVMEWGVPPRGPSDRQSMIKKGAKPIHQRRGPRSRRKGNQRGRQRKSQNALFTGLLPYRLDLVLRSGEGSGWTNRCSAGHNG